jgi:ribosomal protein S18 acetylase RimI-like enzyme
MSHTTTHPVLPAEATLREATAKDIPEMVEVVNAAFDPESFFVNSPRTDQVQLEEHLRRGHFLLVHQGARLVASVYYEVRGPRGYIGMLAVSPRYQHLGLGRAIMLVVEETLRGAGCKVAELTVVTLRTMLLSIYRKLGYREAGPEELPEELRQKLIMPVELIRMEKQL